MCSVTVASRTFDMDDQTYFARLSGDFNPIHMDPVAARRTQAGAVVVHGIHAALWAVDKLVETGGVTERIVSLKVQFSKFIFVGSKVDLKLLRRDGKVIKAELAVGGVTTTTLILTVGTPNKTNGSVLPSNTSWTMAADQPANIVRLEEMTEVSGWIDITAPAKQVEHHFRYAASAIGTARISAIALLSRLVGMICPGLHSLFAEFAVNLVDSPDNQGRIGFCVSETDERFRLVRMNISGAGVCGSVQAFLRWPPIAQAPLSDIVKIVAPNEFLGSTVLIIGGSRGLGALTAKIIAAGGGKVIVTYATGRLDALQVTEEIHRQIAPGVCQAISFDARKNAANQLRPLDVEVSHLYYFATPPITRQKEAPFTPDLLDEFIRIYVKGFYDCCHFLSEHTSRTLTAYYPSSVFVENTPLAMTEYSMAKMVGEMLCDNMNRSMSRINVVVSRLPRLLTDQTATVPPIRSDDAFGVMLPIIRKVQSPRLGSLDVASL